MTTAKAKKPAAAPDNKSIEQKWGKDLVAAGWTAIPNVIFDCSRQLGLKQLDVLIIVHLCRFQKTAALNVRSRLHYSSGGVGSIRQRRAAAGQKRSLVPRVRS